MEDDILLRQLDNENRRLEDENADYKNVITNQLGMTGNEDNANLIKWQLDMTEDLDRIHHLLKGDRRVHDKKGNIVYLAQEDENLRPFNDFGVDVIMNVIQFYLNRNTILSNYDDNTIKWKVLDFGDRIADLIFNRYEDMMNTMDIVKEISDLTGNKVRLLKNGRYVINVEYKDGEVVLHDVGDSILNYVDELLTEHLKQKIKMYPMIVGELVDSVHSAYLRAYNGGERESLRTARMVTQNLSDSMGNSAMPNSQPIIKKKSWNPATW